MRWQGLIWFPIGVAAAVAGLAPWLVHGGAMPLQNLWANQDPSDRPFVLLPFSQYAVASIAALLVEGGAIAGLAARWGRRGSRRVRTALLLLGVLLVQVSAVVQTAQVVGEGLQHRREATAYLALLVAGSLVSALLGAGVLLLLAARRRAPVVVGAALAAALASSWLGTSLFPLGGDVFLPTWPSALLPWVAPVLVGATVAWSGVGTPGRIAAAALAAVSLWVGPALMTGLANSLGTRVYLHDPAEMVDAGVRVFQLALLAPELVLPPLLVGAAIAATGIVVRRRTAAQRSAQMGE